MKVNEIIGRREGEPDWEDAKFRAGWNAAVDQLAAHGILDAEYIPNSRGGVVVGSGDNPTACNATDTSGQAVEEER